jgi:hypothetical protein
MPKTHALKVPTMPREIMLSFFDVSTVMARPWAAAGYLCYCIDMQHPRGETHDESNENIIRVGANVHHWLPPREVEIVFAAFFPPCTDIAVSGARWFRDKGIGKLVDALALFKRSVDLAELLRCPYFIENPVSTVSKYWRPPDHSFDPCDYGDPYTKKTCLWTGGGFVMPPKSPVEPTEGMKLYWLPPSPERANLRSVTPTGFAKAVFEANDPSKKLPSLVKQKNAGRRMREHRHLLAPHIHVLFDKGLLAFEDNGRILISDQLTPRDRRVLKLPAKLPRPPTGQAKLFFKYHRDNVFLDASGHCAQE